MTDSTFAGDGRSHGLDYLVRTLAASGLDVTVVPEIASASFPHHGQHGSWQVYCRSREPVPQVVVYSLHPREVPADRRDATARLLTLVNYGLIIGNFELDLGDGELRFKTSLDFGADRLSGELLATLIEHNLAAFDRYLPVLDAAIDGEDGTAETMLHEIESPDAGPRSG